MLDETIKPDNFNSFIDFKSIFKNDNPLFVEIGCGNGHYLVDQAKNNPEINYIGIDLKDYRIVKCKRKQNAASISNINWICGEAYSVIDKLFQKESVNCFLMTFPDPWPKKRHHKKRLFTKKFLDLIYEKLANYGTFIFITDHLDYYNWCLNILKEETRFNIFTEYKDENLEKSTFAEIWKSENRSFYSFKLEKKYKIGKKITFII